MERLYNYPSFLRFLERLKKPPASFALRRRVVVTVVPFFKRVKTKLLAQPSSGKLVLLGAG